MFAVEEEISPINHIKSTGVRQMCPTLNELPYIEKSARYTLKLKNWLATYLSTCQTSHMKFGSIDESLTINIVRTNRKRKEITKRLCKTGVNIDFMYQGKKEPYLIKTDTPLLCNENMKDKNMFKNEHYTVVQIYIGNGLDTHSSTTRRVWS